MTYILQLSENCSVTLYEMGKAKTRICKTSRCHQPISHHNKSGYCKTCERGMRIYTGEGKFTYGDAP